MAKPPGGKDTKCPECGSSTTAIVPKGSKIVKSEENADGKVWVNCRTCGERFVAYYQERQ